jgi:hypothetical protein
MAVSLVAADEQYVIMGTELAALRTTASFSFWIRTTQAGAADPWLAPNVTGVELAAGTDDIFWGFIDITGGIGLGKGNLDITGTTAVNDGEWHHVLLAWNSSDGAAKIVCDGVLDATGTLDTGDVGAGNAFDGIGRVFNVVTPADSVYLEGDLADVRIYSRILSDSEAETIFASDGHDGIVDGLVSRWTFDDDNENAILTGAADRVSVPNNGTPSGVAAQVFQVDQFAAGPDRIDLDGSEGDQTAVFVAGVTFTIAGATNPGNNGTYTVASSSFGGGETRISVNEDVPTNESGSAATATTADTRPTHVESPLAFRRKTA